MDALAQGLSTGLAVAATTFVTSYLLRSARPIARQDGGRAILEYGRPMKILVMIFWMIAAGVAVAAIFASERDKIIAVCTATGFFLMILSVHLEFFYVSVQYDSSGLRTLSPWRRTRFIPWEAITEVRFSSGLQWYVLSTTSFGKIRLHLYLSGLQSLLNELTKRDFTVPPARPIPK